MPTRRSPRRRRRPPRLTSSSGAAHRIAELDTTIAALAAQVAPVTAELAEALGERHPDVTALVAYREAASPGADLAAGGLRRHGYGGARPR